MKIPVEIVTINGQDKLRQWNPAVKEWQYRDLDPHAARLWRKAIADSGAAGRRALDGVRNTNLGR